MCATTPGEGERGDFRSQRPGPLPLGHHNSLQAGENDVQINVFATPSAVAEVWWSASGGGWRHWRSTRPAGERADEAAEVAGGRVHRAQREQRERLLYMAPRRRTVPVLRRRFRAYWARFRLVAR